MSATDSDQANITAAQRLVDALTGAMTDLEAGLDRMLARPTTLTVPEGHKVTVGAQTASRDYIATVVAGDYPIDYTDTQYNPLREGEAPYYALVRVQIDTPDRTQSSVEFGGVCLATEQIKGGRQPHTMVFYAYQIKDGRLGKLHVS